MAPLFVHVILILAYFTSKSHAWNSRFSIIEGGMYQNEIKSENYHTDHKYYDDINDMINEASQNKNIDNKIINKDVDDNLEDSYSNKQQLTAFLLSFLVGGAGAGRWYVGDIALAAVKLSLTIFSIYFACCISMVPDVLDNKECCMGCMVCFLCLLIMTMFGWYIADVILFGLNEITDSDGLKLQPW